MANTLLTPDIIAKEGLMVLNNELVMANRCVRRYKREFVKKGETITIRKPVRLISHEGADVSNSLQDITEKSITLTVNHQRHVAFAVSRRDMTLSIEEFGPRYVTPAIEELAQYIDYTLTGLYVDVFQAAGNAGVTPNSFKHFANAAKVLGHSAVPQKDLSAVMDVEASWDMADALKGTNVIPLAKSTIRKGYVGQIANFTTHMDQNIRAHTQGTQTGSTPLVNGASQTGTSLITNGWAASTAVLTAGDIFTIAGVYHVNPKSRASNGKLQQFVATSAGTSDGSGNLTISISPEIIITGAYQTVSGSPANDAALTVVGNHTANLAFHKNAFALVMLPLENIPEGSGFQMATRNYNGLALSVSIGSDILTHKTICRVDALFATKTLYPELACRVLG